MARAALQQLDERLATLVVSHDEWETLYRKRLQVERLVAQRTDPRRDGDGLVGMVRDLWRALVA